MKTRREVAEAFAWAWERAKKLLGKHGELPGPITEPDWMEERKPAGCIAQVAAWKLGTREYPGYTVQGMMLGGLFPGELRTPIANVVNHYDDAVGRGGTADDVEALDGLVAKIGRAL